MIIKMFYYARLALVPFWVVQFLVLVIMKDYPYSWFYWGLAVAALNALIIGAAYFAARGDIQREAEIDEHMADLDKVFNRFN